MVARQPAIGFTAKDDSDSSAVLRFNIDSGIEHVAAHAYGTALRGAIDALTDCTIVRQSVVYPYVDIAPGYASAGALNYRVGVLIFSTATPDQYAIIEIPGIRDSMLMSTGPGAGILLDESQPAVIAMVAELTSGAWCSIFGYVLTTLEAAYLQIRPN